MNLKELSIKDKKIFELFLNIKEHALSVYAFPNIYIWKQFFKISWKVIDDALCVFFQDKIGCFLYLPPLGATVTPGILEEVFKVMNQSNPNKNISRIENIEEEEIQLYKKLGLVCEHKFSDYLCLRKDLVGLIGNKFKSKRAALNLFTRNYDFTYSPFSLKYKTACLELYESWSKERKSQNQDTIYQGMLDDSFSCLKLLLRDYEKLEVIGRVVSIENKIKGFSFGYRLNSQSFCILYEITDLSVKGLSQFIFQRFSQDAGDFKYINIMDDSGLENLKKVKKSYHPIKIVPAYIARRDYA